MPVPGPQTGYPKMALTDSAVRNAKPKEKPYKVADAGGLFLKVTPAGGKLWRLKYRIDGKERLLASGIDPSQHKQAAKEASERNSANTFESVAQEWLSKTKRAPTYGPKLTRRLEMYVFPYIGTRPIAEVTRGDMVALLDRIESTGKAETARRIRWWLCVQVFDHAVETDRAERHVMMREWADYLDGLKTVANVVPFRKPA